MKSASMVFFGLVMFLIYLNGKGKLARLKGLLLEPARTPATGSGGSGTGTTGQTGNSGASMTGKIGDKGTGTTGKVQVGTPPFNPFSIPGIIKGGR